MHARVLRGALVLVPALGCATPTALTVDVQSDVGCDAGAHAVLVGTSSLAGLPSLTPSAISTRCAQDTAEADFGTVVLLPKTSKNEPIAFAVMVRPDGHPADGCLDPSQASQCIVAKRELAFIPHTSLSMRIDLRLSCLGKQCPGSETCVHGACVSAVIPNPQSCQSLCTENNLPPADAGAADATVDGGSPNDDCGNTAGLAAGAWPMVGRCPTKIGRSPYVGPQTPSVKWTVSTGSNLVVSGITIGPDGAIYFGSNGGSVYAVEPDGGLRWSTSLPNGNVNGEVGALAADGTLYIASEHAFLALGPDGGLQTLVGNTIGDEFRGGTAIADDGTVLLGTLADLLAAFQGDASTAAVTDTGRLGSPSIAPDGTIYVMSDTSVVFAFRPGSPPSPLWSRPLAPDAGPITNSIFGVMIGRDGNLYAGAGSALVSLDPTVDGGAERWRTPFGATVWAVPVEGPDGTVYVLDVTGAISAVDPTTGNAKVLSNLGSINSFGLIVDAQGTLYVSTNGPGFAAIGADGTVKWLLNLPSLPATIPAIGADGTLYLTASNGLVAVGP